MDDSSIMFRHRTFASVAVSWQAVCGLDLGVCSFKVSFFEFESEFELGFAKRVVD